ncbi:NADPH-dependent 7-cyano-7-deazaguanine reductase QueF [Candidatus Termititenax persephonae]|uniref:NADPH-dependent 7-cyano-7-deazaguanine reductase n=1 Tax=Candidatus Termititenax persephonae TaxID=2218525 RepID=A0A388TFC8_9BACT|nr:NADPH-dependent 7-cyano-7-deazaguanine reductase QueF [Candidatus Termititenax persephonae]
MVRADGEKLPFAKPDSIRPELLETFPYALPELAIGQTPNQRITCTTPEFSAVCPFSGLPDIATVTIEYTPNQKIIELKSLKYYLLSYRQVGIYQEHATQKIFADLQKVLRAKQLKVTTSYNTRGGIDTTCVIEK